MKRKKNKTAVRAVIIYLVVTVGLWMFLFSYSNSYNRLSETKISPASFTVDDASAELDILGQKYSFSLRGAAPESRVYLTAYLLSPDELRAVSLIISAFFAPTH